MVLREDYYRGRLKEYLKEERPAGVGRFIFVFYFCVVLVCCNFKNFTV